MTKIEGLCKKYNLSEDQFTGKENVGGYLYLSSLTSIPEGFNPTVGGSLYLRSKSKYIGATISAIQINKNFFGIRAIRDMH